MATYTLNEEDEANMIAIRGFYESIEKLLTVGRSHMVGGPGSRPDLINLVLELIGMEAHMAKKFQWPDLEARKLTHAKQDKSLQKLIKKASRKTLIRTQ
jgi:hypothetical protein